MDDALVMLCRRLVRQRSQMNHGERVIHLAFENQEGDRYLHFIGIS